MGFVPAGVVLNLVASCTPDANTQAIVFTRSYGSVNAATLQSYLDAGGIALTEYSISYKIWNSAFGTNVGQGSNNGQCSDLIPTSVQFTPNDPFWIANGFQIPAGNTGCGYTVNGFTGITLLGGWSAGAAAFGYRDKNLGRVWATDFDWQDGENPGIYAYTNKLMGYMVTHRK
jgi:hypothetical protein